MGWEILLQSMENTIFHIWIVPCTDGHRVIESVDKHDYSRREPGSAEND